MTNVQPKRVVALIASATEIVCALGARNLLVGRSHECDFPPDVACLPASLNNDSLAVTGHRKLRNARPLWVAQEIVNL
jgi:ABC-type hemin transport system substrate-binding protein